MTFTPAVEGGDAGAASGFAPTQPAGPLGKALPWGLSNIPGTPIYAARLEILENVKM